MNIAMNEQVSGQKKRIHPHKFTLWVGLASVIMMFAGLTSAYIVKRSAPSWITIEFPKTFWYSTVVMLASSLTMQMSLRDFKQRDMAKYRRLLTITALLGSLFVVLQFIGFGKLWKSGTTFEGSGEGQFLYIIAGLHILHVLGGVIALLIMFIKAFSAKKKNYDAVPVEVMSTYWHFVDILWLYLFVFFLTMA
ncbi:cytochrome c oxidase subunit 3 [Pinibacter soli]|uniref:Heme-copper oxidase subunit III n=1 Tax=Pinibacter soli TaxID=3044211 RepID=A0ABT6R8E5_9BACT|nr:heme-copper oxidase subunit III [Pinibacter soli]MDI3318681.1 heme-copper oxidase subunit III [Pinibacter soli]